MVSCTGAPRPDLSQGPIYEYESSGVLNQNQAIVNFRTILNQNFTLFGNYRLGFAKSDTDGAGSFPAYSYDLSNEYGRSSLDIRHNFVLGGSFTMPWKVRLSPFVVASSGRPFNITSGVDTNGDTLYTERPTYTELSNACTRLQLSNSFCDIGGIANPDTTIIPRNYGRGPSFFSFNTRFDKTFGFGGPKTPGSGDDRQRRTNRRRAIAADEVDEAAEAEAAVVLAAIGGGGGAGRGRWFRRRAKPASLII